MITRALLVFAVTLCSLGASAQVPDTAPATAAPAPPPATAPAAGKPADSASPKPKFLGGDVPIFDPANEIVTWDGHSWNLNNNRLFEARFEKYLNAPAETDKDSLAYQNILNTIVAKLGPDQASTASVDEAFRLLKRAANYEIDAHLCDALADAVYSVWRAQDASQRLAQANVALEQERKTNEWNAQVAAQQNRLESAPSSKDKTTAAQWAKDQQLAPFLRPDDVSALRTKLPRFPLARKLKFDDPLGTVRKLHETGVTLLAGTDAPNPGTLHGVSLHRELELLVEAGLKPSEALAAATSVPAKRFGLNDRGRVEPGARADLLLVKGDPTSNIRATRAIVGVWRAGVRLDRDAYRGEIDKAKLAAGKLIGPGATRVSDFEG